MDESLGCIITVVLVLGLLIVVAEANRRAKETELSNALNRYRRALTLLKSDPTNADLRQQTLEQGRLYSHITRDRKGITLFDEVALMNDINAASGGASVPTIPAVAPTVAKPSVEDRLAKLSDLRSKGLINEQEYAARRQTILDEL